MTDDSIVSVGLQDLLDGLSQDTKTELASMPEVVDAGEILDVSKLPIKVRRWMKVTDVVAVVADMKNSTKLGTGKKAASTASIYQASTGGIVNIYDQFGADFLQIQGDGAFALFWGDRRYERAACAGITVNTFSKDLAAQIEKKWETTPETGFKVGIASSRILVKRIGTPRNPAQQEPVWAGKAVNYAAKAAQGADRHNLVVTGTVWDRFEKNDFLAFSCPCNGGPSLGIWENHDIDRLPDDEPDAKGRVLTAGWCDTHGSDYCDAIMNGERKRDDVEDLRHALDLTQLRDALRENARLQRQARLAHRRGLVGR